MLKTTNLLAVDIETTGLNHNKDEITVIGVSDGDQFNRALRGPNMLHELKHIIADYEQITGHNFKFDLKFLITAGLDFPIDKWTHDSSLLAFNFPEKIPASWLDAYELERRKQNKSRAVGERHREAGKYSLKTLAPYFLGVEPFWEAVDHDNDEYAITDAKYTAMLTRQLAERLRNANQKAYQFYQEHHLAWTKMLLFAELQGIRINLDTLANLERTTDAELRGAYNTMVDRWAGHFQAYHDLCVAEIADRYAEMAERAKARNRYSDKIAAQHARNRLRAEEQIQPLNLDSPSQLRWLLTERLGLEAVNLDGEESTDKETLTRLAEQSPDVALLLKYRKAKKLMTTYYPEYKEMAHNGRIFTSFNSIGTRTGRLSSRGPNLQQVPGALHSVFEADPDHVLITRDLSAIEPTVMAYFTEDEKLCELMLTGGDFHGTNAHAMFNLDCRPEEVKEAYPRERKIAKECGLAVLYGAGGNRIYQVLQKQGMNQYTFTDAKNFVYRIRDLYSGVWKFKQQLDKEFEHGATLHNLLGRPLLFQPEEQQDVYMQGLNTLVQSSASDLLQHAAYRVWTELNLPVLLLVHDEVVIQAPEAEAANLESKIVNILKDFPLPTKHGNIPIKSEGKISKTWEK